MCAAKSKRIAVKTVAGRALVAVNLRSCDKLSSSAAIGGVLTISRSIRAFRGTLVICRSNGSGLSATATGGWPQRNHAIPASGANARPKTIPNTSRPIYLYVSCFVSAASSHRRPSPGPDTGRRLDRNWRRSFSAFSAKVFNTCSQVELKAMGRGELPLCFPKRLRVVPEFMCPLQSRER